VVIEITPLASSSRANAHIISDGISPLLLDCGLSIKELRRRSGFGLTDLVGVLVTHEHKDHSRAALDLMRAGIDVYMTAGTAEALGLDHHRLQVIQAKRQFQVGDWIILPFETQHDAKEPVGFLLANSEGERLLYATDTYYVRYKFPGLTHIMVECNYALDILQANLEAGVVPTALKNRLLKSHFSLDNVKAFLKANDLSMVQEIHLIHLSDGNSDAERFKREVQAVTGKPVFIAEK
jgi:phosphoribosyl 1,2-cyclic phosphodiesterase